MHSRCWHLYHCTAVTRAFTMHSRCWHLYHCTAVTRAFTIHSRCWHLYHCTTVTRAFTMHSRCWHLYHCTAVTRAFTMHSRCWHLYHCTTVTRAFTMHSRCWHRMLQGNFAVPLGLQNVTAGATVLARSLPSFQLSRKRCDLPINCTGYEILWRICSIQELLSHRNSRC
jgi:hypothetical protein